ncbi:hypothetical protein RRF57_004914 [Xylaria bambusicola]|uniref:Uncharacterized protein n=1 Tax=Xylaria bambusicola TaxID=326684 RepID=A0AAN7UJC2_9PEZI
MESASINYNGLGDIRTRYGDDELAQNKALVDLYPVKFSERVAVEGVEGWKKGAFRNGEMESLDIVIILLRHLFSMIASEHRQENTNPFAKMIWADLGTPATRDEQSRERARIILNFINSHYTYNRSIDAWNFLENETMWASIWEMPAFRLWDSIVMTLNTENGTWRRTSVGRGLSLGRYSSVYYAGLEDLGERVSSEFITRRDADAREKHQWQAGPHVILRVRYDAKAPGAQSKSFDQLRVIKVRPYRVETMKDANGLEFVGTNRRHFIYFTLVGVVRMKDPAEPGSSDLLRLYGGDGHRSRMPPALQERVCPEKDWELGELGWRYILFYARCPIYGPKDPPRDGTLREYGTGPEDTYRAIKESRGYIELEEDEEEVETVVEAEAEKTVEEQPKELEERRPVDRGFSRTPPRGPRKWLEEERQNKSKGKQKKR